MLIPVNRYIVIELPKKAASAESIIVLPEDYTPPEERFTEVVALRAASDVRFTIKEGDKLIVDRSMIEEISIGATIYNIILDNYVVGMIE